MEINKRDIDDMLIKGNILSISIGETNINARLVKDKIGDYKIALQNYGYYELDCLDYLVNRNNATVHVYKVIPESDYSPIIGELINKLNENLIKGGVNNWI